MRTLKMIVGKVVVRAGLLDTPTADALWEAAPFESRAALWGGEVYFPTVSVLPVERDEGARDVLEPGEIAYRTEGGAIILAWGPTPVSEGDEIRTASPANVFARTEDDLTALTAVEAGDLVVVERVVGGLSP